MTGSAEKRFVNISSIVATIDKVERGIVFVQLCYLREWSNSSSSYWKIDLHNFVPDLPRIEASTAQ